MWKLINWCHEKCEICQQEPKTSGGARQKLRRKRFSAVTEDVLQGFLHDGCSLSEAYTDTIMTYNCQLLFKNNKKSFGVNGKLQFFTQILTRSTIFSFLFQSSGEVYLLKASAYTNVENKWCSECIGQSNTANTAERMAVLFFLFFLKQLSKNYWGRITSTAPKSTASPSLEWKKMGAKCDSLTPMQKQPFNKNIEKTECSLISLR